MPNKISYKEFYSDYQLLWNEYHDIVYNHKQKVDKALSTAIEENKHIINTVESMTDNEYRAFLINLFFEKENGQIGLNRKSERVDYFTFTLPSKTGDTAEKAVSYKKYRNNQLLDTRLSTSGFSDDNSLVSLFSNKEQTPEKIRVMAEEYRLQLCEKRFQDLREGKLKPWTDYFYHAPIVEKQDQMISYSTFASQHEANRIKLAVKKRNNQKIDERVLEDFNRNEAIFNLIENINNENYTKFIKKALSSSVKAKDFNLSDHGRMRECFLTFNVPTKQGKDVPMVGEYMNKDLSPISRRNENLCFGESGTKFIDDIERNNINLLDRIIFDYHKEICQQRWQDYNQGNLRSWEYYLGENPEFE